VKLSDCPHAPGTPEWVAWQHEFMEWQTNDSYQLCAAQQQAQRRAQAAGLRLHEPQFNPMALVSDPTPAILRKPPDPVEELIAQAEAEGDADYRERHPIKPGDFLRNSYTTRAEWNGVRLPIVRASSFISVSDEVLDDATDLTDAFSKAVRSMSVQFQMTADACKALLDDLVRPDALANLRGIDIPEPERRTIKGKPAGRIRTCHHGEPKGKCRRCSQQR
jgi:hypothetical protein